MFLSIGQAIQQASQRSQYLLQNVQKEYKIVMYARILGALEALGMLRHST